MEGKEGKGGGAERDGMQGRRGEGARWKGRGGEAIEGERMGKLKGNLEEKERCVIIARASD